jgi:hypothetical protein
MRTSMYREGTRRSAVILLSVLISFFSQISFAESGRADYDIDDDGLIEINDLNDLNEIRNHLDGSALYGSSAGCPAEGCNGFELTADLDFDTNSDGVIDESDTYWNEGQGWLPIGTYVSPFSAVFNGNFNTINNLYINRLGSIYTGLFGYAKESQILNLELAGPLTKVFAGGSSGILIGFMKTNSAIRYVTVQGALQSDSSHVGGIVGRLSENSHLYGSSAHVVIDGTGYVGGIAGNIGAGVIAEALYSTGVVRATGNRLGGLFGSTSSGNNQFNYSYTTARVRGGGEEGAIIGIELGGTGKSIYWASDAVGHIIGGEYFNATGGAFSLAELRCATSANDESCAEEILFEDWDSLLNEAGEPIWDFGNDNQLPALVWGGDVRRDSDGDGALDHLDTWELNYAAFKDSDGDLSPDYWTYGCDTECQSQSGLTIDHLPLHYAASIDADMDGQPDAWYVNCDDSCRIASGLTIDTQPSDRDNDGINDLIDDDDNSDGLPDADADSDGLIDISTLDQLNAMRYQSDGSGLRLSEEGELNSSGCPLSIVDGHPVAICVGYELISDIDFDSNQDGKFNDQDNYWNSGEGFIEIPRLSGTLEGNGFVIRNLYMDNDEFLTGFMGGGINLTVQNLGFENALVKTSQRHVGGMMGYANNVVIKSSFFKGHVEAQNGYESYVGGLVGSVSANIQISNSYTAGVVKSNPLASGSTGGLVGVTEKYSSVSNSMSSALVSGNTARGIVGYSRSYTDIKNNLFTGVLDSRRTISNGIATKFSGTLSHNYWVNESDEVLEDGFLLSELQCPQSPDYIGCSSGALFENWDESYWNFGTSEELPSLIINGVVHKDSDGDGTLDEDDAWHLNPAASKDSDEDGYPDYWNVTCDQLCIAQSGLTLDQVPYSNAAYLDSDFDGMPDAWADGCETDCQNASGLTLDTYPNDFDNDGEPDVTDTDDNGDGLPDIDADSDGLIDVATLEQLNAIRFVLDGSGFKESDIADLDQSGCPVTVIDGSYQHKCTGYELVANLNFDSDASGQFDAGDTYWNDGEGWIPIGQSVSGDFTAEFHGNGFEISNLTSLRPNLDYVALFNRTKNAYIHDVVLANINIEADDHVAGFAAITYSTTFERVGVFGQIHGSRYLGGIAGTMEGTRIEGSYSSVSIEATNSSYSSVGGLVGYVLTYGTSEIHSSFSSGSLNGGSYIGGLVGRANGYGIDLKIEESFSSASIAGSAYTGGIIGAASNSVVINNSYWVNDYSELSHTVGSEDTGYVGLPLAVLRCAQQADTTFENSDCVSQDGSAEGLTKVITLYKNWGNQTYQNSNGQTVPYWDFGTDQQLPGLNLNGVVVRDADGDGFLDGQDEWPLNAEVAIDADEDNYPDSWNPGCDEACQNNSGFILDQFPESSAVYSDSDLDGQPDSWADSCNDQCRIDSGLTLDPSPNDYDNDGVTDDIDQDDNGDGLPDVDADSDGLIEIATLEQLDAMRHVLDGSGFKVDADAALDDSGCPAVVHNGVYQRLCMGYELIADLDFDSDGSGVFDSGDSQWNDGEGWLHLAEQTGFAAVFHGNGHSIVNLYQNRAGEYYQGLFGSINGAYIHDLHLNDVSITSTNAASSLATVVSNSKVYRVGVTGEVNGASYVGGLFSYIGSSDIEGSYWIGTVSGGAEGDYIGGIAGSVTSTGVSMTSVFVGGRVVGDRYAGGLFGYNANHQITVSASLSTAEVAVNSSQGGIAGYAYNAAITNTYWAKDISGQNYSYGANETAGYVGLSYEVLKCAVSSNTTFENSDCVSEDGSAEGLSSALKLYDSWGAHGYENDSGEFITYWDFGTDQQLPGLRLHNGIVRDSDGDGILDDTDAHPLDHDNDGVEDSVDGYVFIPVTGHTDTDNDGMPDDCETECTELGMTADTDDDNDGVLDDNDFYPQTSLDGRLDTDGDGIPNDCVPACPLPMLADTDDDNDGVPDEFDVFDLDPTEWEDFDGDLIGDNADTDDDNDGVLDVDDENKGQDDGLPVFGTTELAERNISVTTDNGQHASVIFDADYFTGLNASDVFDHTVEIEGSLNGSVFTLEENALLMPSGRQVIQWVAIDDAGNRSTALEQIVNVYPRVRFDIDESVSGEGSNAQVVVRLTGDSPEYPVVVNLQMNAASDTDQDDFAPEFDTALVHQLTIEQGEEETLNREAIFSVPVLQDNVSENDELMLIDLLGVPVAEGEENFFVLDDAHKQHSLTITHENLAPTVQIKFEQDGSEVTNITVANGLVTVTALVVEGNETDTHTYQWTLDESLGLTQPTGGTFTFAPNSLPTGTYNFAVKVTDSGLGNLEAEALAAIELVWFNGYVDTDGDGKPNLCSTECVSLGLEEDLDDDNDGVPDIEDYYELIFVDEANDFDRDGRPDTCDSSCVDATGMSEDLDDDNDGVADVDDPNLGPDDGKPVFDANNAETLHLAVTSANHTSTTLVFDAAFYAAFEAEDVVDGTDVEYKGTWNNNPLVINNDNELILPAGRQVIQWVAVDDAGNESEVVEQVINVYPRVGFDTATSITGEGSEAKITVKLTGDAPAYPVVVNLLVSELSDITQDDVSDEFVIDQIQQLTIEAGENAEEPNREVVLSIPVNQDNVAENDELLIVDVLGIHVPEGEQTFIAVNEDANQHAVTVTQENIAPEVTLLLKQNDVEVANVVQDAGAVSITAQVTDTNGDDTHVLEWNLGDLPLNAPSGNVLNFDPINLDAGSYPISLTATDDGLNPLSGVGNLNLVVVSTDVAPTLQLTLMQDGQPVVNVQKDGGLVTVQVAIVDDEGETDHTLNWDLSELGINAPDGTRLEFDPANITSGIYEISVTVTDENNQTDTKTLSIAVVSADDGRTTGGSDDGGSSGGGGGAMAWYLLLMLSLLWRRRAVVRR